MLEALLTRRPVLLIALLLVSTGLLATGETSQSSAGRVRVDFRAVSSDGSPVRDLAPSDILVRIDGKPRNVSSLEFFESARVQRSAPPVPAPYVTSADPGPSADIYIAFDNSIPVEILRTAVDGLLGALSTSDRVGFVRLRPGAATILPTLRHEEVRGAAAAATTSDDCVAGQSAEALVTLIRGRVDPAPAAIVVFSEGGTAGQAGASPCRLTADDARRIEDAVRGHALQMFFAGTGPQPDGFASIAASTGGRVIDLQPDPKAAMARFALETAAFYVATIELEGNDRNGEIRPLQIGATREGVTVAARTTAMMPPGGRPIPALQPREMVRSGMPYRATVIRAAPYTSSNYDGRVKVVVLFEPDNPSVNLSAATLALLDAAGQIVAQATPSAEELQQRPVVTALVASPGRYRLRIAATDTSRRGGTVEMDVDARLQPAGEITLSSLILGGPDVLKFSPRLSFGDEPATTAYLEMYGIPGGSTAAVRFEITRTPDGPALHTMPAMLPPSSTPGRIATAAIPVADLPSGDYLVTAHISLEGKALGVVRATLRKR